MMYENPSFQKIGGRPCIFTDFVMTIDGKTFVKKEEGYWPIGSKTDFNTFTELRAHADVVFEGKGTAEQFGNRSIATFNSDSFKQLRASLGRKTLIDYIILTDHPDEKIEALKDNPYNYSPIILPSDIDNLLDYMQDRKYQSAFIGGGPTLVASFIERNLVDELFVTIAPKIFGSKDGETITMVEGQLFEPSKIQEWNLLSTHQEGNEVYLRYRRPGL